MIPTNDENVLFPLLTILEDGQYHTLEECIDKLRISFKTTNEEFSEKYNDKSPPSKTKFKTRIKSAISKTRKRKLLEKNQH